MCGESHKRRGKYSGALCGLRREERLKWNSLRWKLEALYELWALSDYLLS